MIITIAISGYRTLREVILPLGRLNIVTGPNGSGKSSLYRSIRLLADAAQGRIISSLASEGGLQSTLWAGPEAFSRGMKSGEVPIQGTVRRDAVSLKLGFASDDYGYAIDLGLPPPKPPSAFNGDPQIKTEAVWVGEYLKRSNLLADRNGPRVSVLEDRQRSISLDQLAPYDSMMTHAAHPRATPELLLLRERMRDWRVYDHFRTDRDAPARRPQIGTRTPALSADGADLAAAFQTIDEIGASQAMHDAIADAFPGTAIEIETNNGMFEILLRQHGLLRPLRAAELSDGTLRYLLLIAALLTPRPPPLMVLNEPETSLHSDLLAPLARLIAHVAQRSQIIVVSHAQPLVDALSVTEGATTFQLEKALGETIVANVDPPAWSWPKR